MSSSGWLKHLLRPLVVGLMMGCIALSLVELVRLFFPAWNGTFLIVGCVLAAVEANYSYHVIRARELRGDDVLRFRAVELALFFTVLKASSYVGDDLSNILRDIRLLPSYPFAIFDPETMVAFVLAVASWWASTQTIIDMERVGEPPEHWPGYVPPVESLSMRFFWGGEVLLVVAGLTRVGIAELLNLRHPPVPGLVLNVLAYFLLGLVVLAEAHFASLRSRWQARRAKIASRLGGRWVRYSLGLVGLAALIAFLLPTRYTFGLIETAGFIIDVILAMFSLISAFFFLICGLPLAWLMSLFRSDSTLSPLSLEPSQVSPLSPREPGAAFPWLDALRSLVFWAVVLGAVFYVIRSYLRERPELLEALVTLRPVHALRRLWAALWGRLGRWNERFPRKWSLPWVGRKPSLSGRKSPFRFFRLGALSPRERVFYYYLSILKRAGKQGFPRRHAQTPYEYSAILEPRLSQAEEEMASLTQAFVEARYSPHTIEPDWAGRARAHWQRVKAALRALKQKIGESPDVC